MVKVEYSVIKPAWAIIGRNYGVCLTLETPAWVSLEQKPLVLNTWIHQKSSTNVKQKINLVQNMTNLNTVTIIVNNNYISYSQSLRQKLYGLHYINVSCNYL